MRQADAQVRIAGAPLLPSISGSGSAAWQHEGTGAGSAAYGVGLFRGGSNSSIDFHSYSAGLSAAYELDFWGRNRATRQSAVASAMFSRFDQQTVALTIVTDVANTWFTALSLADRLAVARSNLKDAEQTLAVIRGRFDCRHRQRVGHRPAGVAGRRRACHSSPASSARWSSKSSASASWSAQPPERISVRPGTLTALGLPPVASGLPSELLARRPDVASAEAQLVAQNFSITVARAAFFPSIQLTASAGYEAPALNRLITPGGALASLAAGLTQPIFDGGTLRGQLDLAKGRHDELLADYRKAVVQAFTDVDTALTAWRYATRAGEAASASRSRRPAGRRRSRARRWRSGLSTSRPC